MPVFHYTNGLAHLDTELERVRLLLGRYVNRHRARFIESPVGQLHSFVTSAEMRVILEGRASGAEPPDDGLPDLEAAHGERERAGLSSGVELPLANLADRLRLTRAERDLALLVAAPELSFDLHRAYRHALADFTLKHGTIPFFEELLLEAGHRLDATRQALSTASILRRLGLMRAVADDAQLIDAPPTALRLIATNRFVDYLLGRPLDPHGLPPGVRLRTREGVVDVSRETEYEVLGALAWGMAGAGRRVLLVGAEGVGRRSLVRRAFRGLIEIDLLGIARDPVALSESILTAMAEARMRGMAIYVHGVEALANREDEPWVALAFELVRREQGLVVIGLERPQSAVDSVVAERPGSTLRVLIPMPDAFVQRQVWDSALPPERLFDGFSAERLAQRYALTPGKIRAAAAFALARAESRGSTSRVTREELDEGVRTQLAHRLGGVATRIETPFSRHDLILPEEVMTQLDEILSFYRQRPRLLSAWGFDRILAYGRGLSALFSGPPGTGKTMAAGVIARELGLELFQVDLSQVTDKYIGETEKKMARIFDEAGRGQAILLFDEADSVFARRTEVKSSTDRYANLGVNFLLQRMEQYEGITILTTNLESSIDEAFRRRIRFKVALPAPDEHARHRLWRSIIPREAPQEPNIDFESLSHEFDLVGADIKNVVIKAASIAAERHDRITTEGLRQAARQIYRERGKLVRGG